ncbi:MAG: tetratricopeptide repeat protein [Sphingopyxis sp.]|nr:tetratricopeptide repeat protein [Sphingopyxis sp.]
MAQTLEPEDASIQLALGTAYFRQDNFSEAIRYYEKGVQLKPDSPGALFDLGNAYYMTDQLDKALTTYEKAVALGDDFWEAINNIGLVQYEQGKADDAIAQWTRAVAINGKAAEPKLALAAALHAKANASSHPPRQPSPEN